MDKKYDGDVFTHSQLLEGLKCESKWKTAEEGGVGTCWRAPKSRGETKLRVSQSQDAESRLGSTLPASNSRKG
jgi:hypothetical protein